MEEIKLKPYPKCGGGIVLYSDMNPEHPYFAVAICKKCRERFPLPAVKVQVWKSNPLRISKKMIHDAEKAWNKRTGEDGDGE